MVFVWFWDWYDFSKFPYLWDGVSVDCIAVEVGEVGYG